MAFAAVAPLIAAGIGAAGSVAGGLLAKGGGASGAIGAGTGLALSNINDQIKQDRSYLSPWAQVGNAAVNQLAGLYGLGHLDATPTGAAINGSNYAADQAAASARFFTSPGYDFRVQQGVNALDRSAASRGALQSGAQRKALSDYTSGQASSEYGNYVNQLNNLSGSGLGAVESGNNTTANLTGQGVGALTGGAAQQASYDQQGANAGAAGLLGATNSLASGLTATNWSKLFGSGNVPGGTAIAPFGSSLGGSGYA